MKKIFKYSMVLAAAALVLVSCKEEETYEPGTWNANPGYQDVAFEKASFSQELDPADATVSSVVLYRNTDKGTATVPVKIIQNTDDVFVVDPVTFADGDSTTVVTFSFNNAEVGKPYTLELFIDDPDFASNYSQNTTYTYTVTRVKWNPAGYVEVGGQRYDGYAMYTDDFFTTFWSVQNLTWPTLLEERADRPGYFRMVNTYHEGFGYNDPGDWDDTTDHYIFIDATNPDKVYIPELCYIGVNWGYGDIGFYSIAGLRLAQGRPSDAEDYYGTYKNGAITFPESSLLIGMSEYNDFGLYQANTNSAFKLVIDPSLDLYQVDIEEDYDYEDMYEGAFTSNQLGASGSAVQQKGTMKADIAALAEQGQLAETAGTPYRWVSPYVEGFDLYFLVDDEGLVVVPEGYELQPIGVDDNMGHDIYAKITGGASTFSENETVLNITFQSEDGELVFGTANETLANITWTQLGVGTFWYSMFSSNEDGSPEPDEGYPFLKRDDKEDVYAIGEWLMGTNFTFTWDKTTNKCVVEEQAINYVHPTYGMMYILEGALYSASKFGANTSYYDPATKTFHFFPVYFVSAGYFGQVEELFEITEGNFVKRQTKTKPHFNTWNKVNTEFARVSPWKAKKSLPAIKARALKADAQLVK